MCRAAAGAGILPAATLTTQGAAEWANKHLARGIYDLLALLGSHATLDNKHCVKNNDTSGGHIVQLVWLSCRQDPMRFQSRVPVLVHTLSQLGSLAPVSAGPVAAHALRSPGTALTHTQSALITPAGPFAHKQRMFSWNAPATYYTELATTKLEGPIPDQESEDFYRVDPPQHVSEGLALLHLHR